MKKEQAIQPKVKLKKTEIIEPEGDIEDNVTEKIIKKQKKFKKRLFLGEATFSYTDGFLLRKQEKLKGKKGEFEKLSGAIVATEYRKENDIYKDYPEKQDVIKSRIEKLQTVGVQLNFEVDATKLEGREIKIRFNVSIKDFLKSNHQKDSYIFLLDSEKQEYCLFYINLNGQCEEIKSLYKYGEIITLLEKDMVRACFPGYLFGGLTYKAVLNTPGYQQHIDTAVEVCKPLLWEVITAIQGHELQSHKKELGNKHFKRIHFNFPQAENNEVTKNLVSNFFKSAKHIQNKNDKIHMALPKEVNGGAKDVFKKRYDILNASSESGYILERKRKFINTKNIHERDIGFELYYFPEGIDKYLREEGKDFLEQRDNSYFFVKQNNTIKIWRISHIVGDTRTYEIDINKFNTIMGEELELLEEGQPLKNKLDSIKIDKLWSEITLAQGQYHRYPQYKHERTKDYKNDKSYYSVNNSREFIFKKTDLKKEECLKTTEKNLSIKTDSDSSDCYESDIESVSKLKK